MAPTGIPRTFLETIADVDDGQSKYVLEDGTTVKPRIVNAKILDSLRNFQ